MRLMVLCIELQLFLGGVYQDATTCKIQEFEGFRLNRH